MGVVEAKSDLLKNIEKLRVWKKGDAIWRTTMAGTSWVMFRWGYRDEYIKKDGTETGEIISYELHVHGTSAKKITEASHDSKVCGENLKGGEVRLSNEEWRLVAKKVKELAGA